MDAINPTQRNKLSFPNAQGDRLDGLYQAPMGPTLATVLFAHCFTCSKQIGAATRISRTLAARGFGVLRFDFTGLGNSDGDFANTNFSSNVADLVSAADYLRDHYTAPAILIGHSLGGAAVIAAASQIEEAKAVITIAAPSDPAHVAHLIDAQVETIQQEGCALVDIAGRQFPIKQQFLDDIGRHSLDKHLRHLKRALLVFHSPVDNIVGIEHARAIYTAAKHPKSFISLDDADHMLNDPRDATYVGETIAAWAGRYIGSETTKEPETKPLLNKGEVLVSNTQDSFTCDVYTEEHHLVVDEPTALGGNNLGPSPYDMLLTALGSCTAITLRMYARHKKLPVTSIEVKLRQEAVHTEDCEHCETTKKPIQIIREIHIEGELDPAQRERMLDIANRCPVHQVLTRANHIETRLR